MSGIHRSNSNHFSKEIESPTKLRSQRCPIRPPQTIEDKLNNLSPPKRKRSSKQKTDIHSEQIPTLNRFDKLEEMEVECQNPQTAKTSKY